MADSSDHQSEASRMEALRRSGLLDPGPDAAFDDLVELAAQLCETPMATISLVDGDHLRFKASRGVAFDGISRDHSFCGAALRSEGVFEVPDAAVDERFATAPLVAGPPHIRFYAGIPLRTEDGHALGMLCVFDAEPRALTPAQRWALVVLADQVMAQVQLRQALRESRAVETRQKALIQRATDIAAVIDAEARIRYVSPSASEQMGYTLEEMSGLDGLTLLHPDDWAMATTVLAEAVAAPGVPQRVIVRLRHKDGSYRWFEATATNFLDHPDIGGIVANIRDVTQEREAQDALRESQERFEALVQHSSDLIVVFGEDGFLRFVSPAVTGLLGYDLQDIDDLQVNDFVHPAHHGRVAAIVARVAAGGEAEPAELKLLRCDSSYRWFEARAANLLDHPAVRGIVVNLRDISDRKIYETRLVRQALHDPLTDLPNRALLEDRLAHALTRAGRERALCGLLFLDIDRFKLVNDTAGHAAGDLLIAEVAARVTRAVRPADTVARFGGDEFAVLCEDLQDVGDAVAISSRIHAQLEQPFRVADRELGVSVSIGVAAAEADESAASLVQAADTAMYAAKERGGGRTEVFAEELRSRVVSRLDLLAGLQHAVGGGELYVEYQPIFSMSEAQEVVGAEALVRWRHPEHGNVAPDVFIPLAEETGLIDIIGIQVLEDAMAHAPRWRRRQPEFFVSVNVSSRQISGVGFGEAVGDVLARAGADAESLLIELTEGTLVRADDTNAYNLKELDRLGVRLAIDDFGTGYSSLAYLKTLEADVLKIDGSFTRGVATGGHDRSIVEAICSLGHGFGLIVVAEHVEHEDQLEVLRSLGCDLAQGYLLTAPGPAEEIDRLLGG